MTAALVEDLVAVQVDSLEVRWIIPGPLGTAMREWFARFPAGTETREDAYLLQPRLQGLSVKLRDGSSLDVKSYLGSPGILGLPGHGRLESWRKWSFPYQPSWDGDTALPGWIIVRKRRHACWFPLATSHRLAPVPRSAPRAGCMVELTEVRVHDRLWWSLGLEATGSAGLLRLALQHAADLAFAQPLPTGVALGLDNSRSYAQWLNQRSNPDAEEMAHPEQDLWYHPRGLLLAGPGSSWSPRTQPEPGRGSS